MTWLRILAYLAISVAASSAVILIAIGIALIWDEESRP